MVVVHLWCIFLLSASANLADDSQFRGDTPWARYFVAGRVALDTGEYARAISIYKQALLAIPQTGRENRLDCALAADELALSNLGTVCFHRGAFAEARRYYEEALSIDRRIFGSDSATIARDLNTLAAVDMEEGKFTHAERLLRHAIENGRSVQSRESRITTSMRNLAVLFARLHRLRDPIPLYEQIVEMQRAAEGPDHPAVGRTLSELAHSELGLKKCAAAEGHARQALEILRSALGEEHASTATAYRALGLAYHCGRRPELAEPALRHVVEIDQKVEHGDIPRVDHLREYAAVLRSLGRKDEAKKFETMAKAARAAAPGKERPHIVDVKELQAANSIP